MVSEEILDFWFMIIGIILACVVLIMALWALDRSRRNTPAFALGRAMQDAWAAKQSYRIATGQAQPMPTTVEGLEDIATESMQTHGYDPTKIKPPTQAELKDQADALEKKKAKLESPPPPI